MSSDEDDELPYRPRGRKRESLVGNLLEALATYMLPLFYTLVACAWIAWGPNAQTADEQIPQIWTWVIVTGVCFAGYGLGVGIGTQARFSANPTRLFGAGLAAVCPGLTFILLAAIDAAYVGLDAQLAAATSLVTVPLAFQFFPMWQSVRRVREVTGER